MHTTALAYITRNRLRLQEELPTIEEQAKQGLVGSGAPGLLREVIAETLAAEQEIKERLGNPC